MKHLQLFSIAFFSGLTLLACSGPNADKAATANNSDPAKASGDGKDMYYEYTITGSGKDISMNGSRKLFISSSGDMRVEMDMITSFRGNKSTSQIISIAHSDKPGESILLDDSAKTYSVYKVNEEDLSKGVKIQSNVSKIGEETIMGFRCVHARIINNKTYGGSLSVTETIDLWRSNEVPVQANVKALMDRMDSKSSNAAFTPDAAAQLKQLGCEGFLVKMTINSKNASTNWALTKTEHRNLPSGLFQIPAGYTEVKDGMGE